MRAIDAMSRPHLSDAGAMPGYEADHPLGFHNSRGAPVRKLHTKAHSLSSLVAAPVECKFAGAKGKIAGYGSIFGNQDMHGDIVERGAFAESLAIHKAAGTMPAMLWQHDPGEPIGIWEAVEEDERGLKMSGQLNLDTQRGREAMALVKQQALNGLSIGFIVKANGVDIDRHTGVRHLKRLDLWEVSLVTFPSNGKARLTDTRRSRHESSSKNFCVTPVFLAPLQGSLRPVDGLQFPNPITEPSSCSPRSSLQHRI